MVTGQGKTVNNIMRCFRILKLQSKYTNHSLQIL